MDKMNKKIILTILFVAIVLIGLFWFVFFFQIPGIAGTAEAIQKEKLDSFVRKEKEDKLFKLKKELVGIEDQEKEMEGAFIPKNEAVPFFRALEKAAADASCQIKVQAADLNKVKFSTAKQTAGAGADDEETATKKQSTGSANQANQTGEAAKADELAKLKAYPAFNVEVVGSFASIMDFLKKMENLPYFARVLMFDLTPAEKTNSQAAAAGSGSLATAGGAPGNNPQVQEKSVKLSLLIIVYTNEQK